MSVTELAAVVDLSQSQIQSQLVKDNEQINQFCAESENVQEINLLLESQQLSNDIDQQQFQLDDSFKSDTIRSSQQTFTEGKQDFVFFLTSIQDVWTPSIFPLRFSVQTVFFLEKHLNKFWLK